MRSRVAAIAVIYALLLVLVVVFFVVVGPKVTREGAKLGQSLPTLLTQLSSGQIAQQLGAEHGWNKKSIDLAQSFLAQPQRQITQLAQRIGLRVADVAKQAWLFFVVPLLSIFFLKDGRSFSDFLLSTIQSRPQREFLENVLNDLNQMLAHFIRAQLTLAALTLVMYSAVLGIMGVPYALVLGTLGGVLEFIPVVGPLAAALVIVGVALLMSYQHWLILIVFLGIWRLIQDYVSSPRIMGESMELHPLAAIFGVMAGGEVAGILGIYLSIPVMAACASSSAAGDSTPKRKNSARSPNIPSTPRKPITRRHTCSPKSPCHPERSMIERRSERSCVVRGESEATKLRHPFQRAHWSPRLL